MPRLNDREWHYERPEFDEDKQKKYVAAVRKGLRRYKAAEYVKVSFDTVKYHLNANPVFLELVLIAEQARVDEVEESMYANALKGNVTAQQTILYNRRPEEWTDQRSIREREIAAQQQAELAAMKGDTSELDKLKSMIDALIIKPVVVEADDEAPA